ncbi:MAG TPA: hypothetical protein VHE35_16000, partial [Kofleriaceae bacterium]|nr:hypothetical protein [Kofleriaceae bacterium]
PASAGSAVAGLPGAVWDHDVLVGNDQMCALQPDGRVICWGQNGNGEVGDVRGVAHPVPVLVPGVRDAVTLAAGPSGTCAATRAGLVWCWGSYDPDPGPHPIAGVTDAVEVAVTSMYRCARRRDGQVWCWAAYDGPSGFRTPTEVRELAGARRLAAGHDSLCAVLAGGDVRCALFPGPHGDGPRAPMPPPVFLDVPAARGAVQLAAYFQSTCAVLANGHVVCWLLEDERSKPALQVSTVKGLRDAIDLGMGLSQLCAARRSGGAVCWWSSARAGVESPTTPADELRRFRALALTSSATCGARPDGTIVCWGDDYGTLGRYGARTARPTPVAVAGLTDATELAVEQERACARRRDRSVVCWDEADRPAPVAGVRADHLFAGALFTCAAADGTPGVRCWGARSWQDCVWESEDNCQLVSMPAPEQVDGLLGIAGATALGEPCVIAADGTIACRAGRFQDTRTIVLRGVTHARSVSGRCAVDGAGAVRCWTAFDDNGPPSTDVGPPLALPPAAEVVAGRLHACARTEDGHVWCWGEDRVGELGDGLRARRDAPAQVAGQDDVVQLAAGDLFTCARTRAGAVLCWGSNLDGALGDGSGRDQLRPVAVAGLTDAVELRANGASACARRAGGTVVCWGHHRGGNIEEIPADRALPILAPDSIE